MIKASATPFTWSRRSKAMADEPNNIVLVMLRKIDQRTERMAEDLHDLKVRVTGVEEGLAGVNRRLDRLEGRIERIEKRIELTDATH
jgi:archaellum component FlaC